MHLESTYISICAVPRLAANTQFAQRRPKPTGSFTNFSTSNNTSHKMAPKKPEIKFSIVQQCASGTTYHVRVLGHQTFAQSRNAVRTTPSSTEHIKILEGMGF
ncbi:uncharacterized protein FPRN_13838 [Fusarium proliferatum]|nr:uncharacterized protein FPRN_13838 [Fusarium proliferatum]